MTQHRRVGAVVRLFALILLAAVSACTWVKLTPEGKTVTEAEPAGVTACRNIGHVGATTADRIIFKRNAEVMRKEQVALARNQAATLGGDTIVAKGPATGPTLQFDVYRCH